MTHRPRHYFLAMTFLVSVFALGGCATSSDNANMTDPHGASRVDAILERAAREAKAGGNKQEALALVEQIYNRNKKDAALATGFAEALREDNQLNRARQIILPFTKGKTPFPDAVTELAMIQLALGQYKEAELSARRAVELSPELGRPFLALGTALDAQNYHEQAEIAFRRGLERWKGDPAPILNNLALNLASQNKLDQAMDMLLKAKEISPGRMEIERNLRIISTLREGADDFLIKQEQKKKEAAAAAAKPAVKKPQPTPTTTKKEDSIKQDTAQEAAERTPASGTPKQDKVETEKPKKMAPKVEPKPEDKGNKQNFSRQKAAE